MLRLRDVYLSNFLKDMDHTGHSNNEVRILIYSIYWITSHSIVILTNIICEQNFVEIKRFFSQFMML